MESLATCLIETIVPSYYYTKLYCIVKNALLVVSGRYPKQTLASTIVCTIVCTFDWVENDIRNASNDAIIAHHRLLFRNEKCLCRINTITYM